MSIMSDNGENDTPLVDTVKKIIGCIATCIGLIVLLIGLKYAIDIFQLIFTMLRSPTALADPVHQLAATFGGNAFDIKLPDRTVPLAKIIALIIYCCGVLLSAFLTMALMQTGAKIVSLTAGDRSAVKQLLQSAFGNRARPKTSGENSDIRRV